MRIGDGVSQITASDLFFSYPDRHVFNGSNFNFEPGATWLQGGNGSGKSTLLKLLAGVLEPQAGTLTANGVGAEKDPLEYRKQVFWCGPDDLPFNHLQAIEYLSFIASLYPKSDTCELDRHLEGLGLRAHLQTRIERLSTGTKKKVWHAAALISGTPVALLDEPLNAVDNDSATYLLAQLNDDVRRGQRCWVVTSHEPLPPNWKSIRLT